MPVYGLPTQRRNGDVLTTLYSKQDQKSKNKTIKASTESTLSSPGRPVHKILASSMKITTSSTNVKSCETFSILEKEARSWMEFVDEYVHRHKVDILNIEPSSKRATRTVRQVLAEMLHDAIDAAVNDINEAFSVDKRSRGSASSSHESLRATDKEIEDEDDLIGAMSDDEDGGSQESTLRLKVLEQIVREQMAELAEGIRDAIDDAL